MSDQVWVSRGLSDGSIHIPFRDPDTALTFRERVRLIDNVRRGVLVDRTLLPSRLVFDGPHSNSPNLLFDIFVDAYMVVSEPVMQVFPNFELGETRLFPVELLDKNLEKITDVPYFIVAFAEARTTVSGGNALINIPDREGVFHLNNPLDDGDVEIFRNIPAKPDIWVDPHIVGAIFLSDRLHGALKAAGFLKRMTVKKCSVVEE